MGTPPEGAERRPPFVIHVDMDGVVEIARAHGRAWTASTDPLFESGTLALLDLLDRFGLDATFFVVSDSLDDSRKRDLVEEIVRRGHEIASHTASHRPLRDLDTQDKRREIFGSRERLEAELGTAVRGFRAPGYGIDRESIDLLTEAGYAWDSSAFPSDAFATRLGVPSERLERPGRPFEGCHLIELPLPDHRPFPVPTHPSYSLLIGSWFYRFGMRRAAERERPLVLLFHLTDLADALPSERARSWSLRFWTLSFRDQASKVHACEQMLHSTLRRFRAISTRELCATLPASEAAQRPR